MEEVASTSGTQISPPRRRKLLKLGHLSVMEKLNILNIFKKLRADNPRMRITAIVARISSTIGVAQSTIYRTINEYKVKGQVTAPKQSSGRHSLIADYDETVKNAIRQLIHRFFYKNELPTLDKVLNEIKQRDDLPQMSRSTLYKFMKMINFRYRKRDRKSVLIERDDIIRWRRRYLMTIKDYRRQNRPIYYLDETWLNEGHTKQKVWVDDDIKSRRQAFNEGLTTGLRNPTGKGRRLIILHIGSKAGFEENGLLLFEGKKTSDYHEEMNAEVFERWFHQILTVLPDNAVIVMDNATYHSRRIEKIPTTTSRKLDMQAWLKLKNIEYGEEMVRSELLHLIRLNKDRYNTHVTDKMAKSCNKTLLRLPPYHCELNPIELVWAQIKNEVATKNTSFKLADVRQLLLQAIQNVTTDIWKKCVEHVIKEERRMCELDGLIDDIIEPFIISVGKDSSSEMESDSE